MPSMSPWIGSSVGEYRRITGSIPAPASFFTRYSLSPMFAPLFRNVTHLTPMRCASATKRSTTAGSCLVVGTQCMPRPLSPLGCGYWLSANAVADAVAVGSVWVVSRGGSTGFGGVRSTVLGAPRPAESVLVGVVVVVRGLPALSVDALAADVVVVFGGTGALASGLTYG